MKNIFLFLNLLTFLYSVNAFPQTNSIPLKNGNSVFFGNDLFINDQPSQNQKPVAICSAFNGWLYAAFIYDATLRVPLAKVTVMKSIDNGLSWSFLFDNWWPSGGYPQYSTVDIVTTGNSISNLKVILAMVVLSNTTLIGSGHVERWNGITGMFEQQLVSSGSCYDIALATDFLYPATSSNPHSLGILYSTRWAGLGDDSLYFRSSSDGGMSLDNERVIASTGKRFHKVALAYGRSPSWSSGRYFAAWEEQDVSGSMPGRIYTSHSNPNFNSAFTTPVRLDDLDPANTNQCINPAISCQYSNVDNDSSNLTAIVLFDRYNPSNNKYDINSYYNLQATNHTKFWPMNISDPLHSNSQSDIAFNPFDYTFMMTYFDSTTLKLPFLVNNFNLRTPNNWQLTSQGYNDNTNLSNPYPKITVNFDLHSGATSWIANRDGGNGAAMFDAVPHFWVGIPETTSGNVSKQLVVYPNPCSNELNFEFELEHPGKVTIILTNIFGQSLHEILSRFYPKGKQQIHYEIKNLPQGNYIYSFKSDEYSISRMVTIIR